MESFYPGYYKSAIRFAMPNRPTMRECLAVFTEYLNMLDRFSREDLKQIETYWEYFQIGKNKSLVSPGEVCHHIFFICKGAVKQVVEDQTGRYIIDFMTDGYFCTQLSSFLHERPAKDNLFCVKPTYGVRISLPNLRQLCHDVPAFAEFFRAMGEDELYRVIGRLTSFQATDARGRYDLLMRENSSVFNLFTMLDIANYLGIKPETLSRLRNEKG